jgi:hypothetical protein
MAAGRKVMASNAGLAAAALVALLVVAAASGAAGKLCGINPSSLANECRSYCRWGSTDSAPSGQCCAALKGAQFSCLCQYKAALPSDIDPKRAMEIPNKCDAGAPTSCK